MSLGHEVLVPAAARVWAASPLRADLGRGRESACGELARACAGCL